MSPMKYESCDVCDVARRWKDDRKNLSVEPAGKRKLTKKMMVIFN